MELPMAGDRKEPQNIKAVTIAIFQAARDGDIEGVHKILEASCPPFKVEELVNHKYFEIGNTLLYMAVLNYDVDMVKYLLSRGVNILSPNSMGTTPLHVAIAPITTITGYNSAEIEDMNVMIVAAMLEKVKGDASLKEKLLKLDDEEGLSVLDLAVRRKNLRIVRMLMPFVAKDVVDVNGDNLLQQAIKMRALDLVRYFAEEERLDLFAKNNTGLTAVDLAASSIDMISLLEEVIIHYPDYNLEVFKQFLQITETIRNYNTLATFERMMTQAVKFNRVDIVKHIIEKAGFSPEVVCIISANALSIAIIHEKNEIAKYLLENKFRLETSARNHVNDKTYTNTKVKDLLYQKITAGDKEAQNNFAILWLQSLLPLVENLLPREPKDTKSKDPVDGIFPRAFLSESEIREVSLPDEHKHLSLKKQAKHFMLIKRLPPHRYEAGIERIQKQMVSEAEKIFNLVVNFPAGKSFAELQEMINKPFLKIVAEEKLLGADAVKLFEDSLNQRGVQLRPLIESLVKYGQSKPKVLSSEEIFAIVNDLFAAARKKDLQTVMEIFNKHAAKLRNDNGMVLINIWDFKGNCDSLLHVAIHLNDPEMAKFLLSQKINENHHNKAGDTPLDVFKTLWMECLTPIIVEMFSMSLDGPAHDIEVEIKQALALILKSPREKAFTDLQKEVRESILQIFDKEHLKALISEDKLAAGRNKLEKAINERSAQLYPLIQVLQEFMGPHQRKDSTPPDFKLGEYKSPKPS